MTTRKVLTPEDAHEMASAGEILLVDVRQPQEWAATGIGASATAISMHEPGFLTKLQAAGGAKDAAIALICASGGRTAFLQGELEKIGYVNVHDVSEGMQGGPNGPGWIRRGLPTKLLA